MKRLSDCFKGTYIYMSVHPENFGQKFADHKLLFLGVESSQLCNLLAKLNNLCVSKA